MSERNDIDPAQGRPLWRAVFFTSGFACALLGCAVAGKLLSERNIFKEFGRFHTQLSPESYFQPTAREVSFLARDVLDRSKTNVVVGGSSVFYGVGQPEGQTLADNLRRELGDGYRVINLAMRGGDVSGIAELAVESLTKDGYRVIYLSDIGVGAVPQPIGSAPYQYFYWDSRARNMLLDAPIRDAAVQAAMVSEPVISATLNRFTYVFELWNTIGYEWIFTVYSRLIPPPFWRPRGSLPDNEIDPPESLRYRNTELELRIIEHLGTPLTETEWTAVRRGLAVAVPEGVRKSTILAICENSPWLLDQSTEQVRYTRKLKREAMAREIELAGMSAATTCDGLEKGDYVDRVHLSIHGARKIAPRLADSVRRLAQRSGWIP